MPITHRRKLPLKVLFATPEIRPLIKTGGLGDVSASLPAALMKAGIDVRVLVPGYPSVLAGAQHECLLARTHLPGAGEVTLLSAHAPDSGVPLIIVDCPAYYDRKGGPYQDLSGLDWPDNAQRFALFSKIGALIGSSANPLDWQPHVVHCNDWQTGLTPAYLHYTAGPKSPTIMTIHNIAYQGIFPSASLAATGLPPESFSMHGVEYHGSLSFLKAGLFYADRITTVSPTYAREIQGKLLGFGMQGLLAERSALLSGILNGIDEEEWNPWHDPYLVEPFHGGRLKGKAANKRALQERLGLAVEPDVPLLGVVSRITHQKGLDLLLATVDDIITTPAQIVLLGTGEAALEASFRSLAARYPGTVSVTIGFNEALSHQIEAAADIFLMPSRFEPCGLNQMYSQRYGAVPLVHATGGLVDTVVDATADSLADGSATGFVFVKEQPAAFLATVQRALSTYRDKKTWRALMKNGMRRDFSWKQSAQGYVALYEELVKQR
jgi:starch synthase